MSNRFFVEIESWQGRNVQARQDEVVGESPLDIRVLPGDPGAVEQRIAVTLRTPGDDIALVLGYLFSEGVITSAEDCSAKAYTEDMVGVTLQPWVQYSERQLARGSVMHSGCGLCGKTFIESIHALRAATTKTISIPFSQHWLQHIPNALESQQALFLRTGGSHAAALFTSEGELLYLKEDIGRHNAVDKVIGSALLNGRSCQGTVLWLSGRVGFELVHKAVMAGIGMVIAVGAPSSLGIEIAEEFDMTLVAFARDNSVNVYHQGSDKA